MLADRMRLPLSILIATLLLPFYWSRAAAPAGSKERLCRLVRLPRLNLTLGISLDPSRGIAMTPDRPVTLHQVETLRAAMQGNASDASRHTRIGRLLDDIGSTKEARQAFAKAIELYRSQDAEQGDDGAMLAEYGTALQGMGDLDAAERALRHAVRVAPRTWEPNAALGRLLAAQALATLTPPSDTPGTNPLAALLSASQASRGKLAPAQVDRAQRQIEEALLSYNRAIELAPDAPDPFSGRAAVRAFQSLLRWLRDPDLTSEPRSWRLVKTLYPPEAFPDLRRAAELAPKDPQAIGTAILFEVFSSAFERGLSSVGLIGTRDTWGSLPEAVRQSIRESLARLEEISQAADAVTASAALELLGNLQCFLVNDLPGAERTLRRATALHPSRPQAWETLVYILASSKRTDALLAVCADRLKAEETPRVRLLLAKAYESLSDWDRVLETTQTLQQRYPDDFYANLAFAAALLRSTHDETTLGRAVQALAKAETLLGSAPPREHVVNLLFLRGLVLGLAGHIEPALDHLTQLQQIDRDHEGLQEALEILRQM